MSRPIRVAILEDHQGIIDGYLYRLNQAPDIEIAGIFYYADELEKFLKKSPLDLLIMDLLVPISKENPQHFPVLHTTPGLLRKNPGLRILVISMLADAVIFENLLMAGIAGYILKEDYKAIQQLAQIVSVVAHGGAYFSQNAMELRLGLKAGAPPKLTPRQAEVLSLLAAYPFATTDELAGRLGVAPSTLRNILSGIYQRLGVQNRMSALARAEKLGLIIQREDA